MESQSVALFATIFVMSDYVVYLQSKGVNNTYVSYFAMKVNGVAVCPYNDFIDESLVHWELGYKHTNLEKGWPTKLRYAVRYLEGLLLHLKLVVALGIRIEKGTIYWSLFYFVWFEKLAIRLLSLVGYRIVIVVHDFDQKMFEEANQRTGLTNSMAKRIHFYKMYECIAHTTVLSRQLVTLGITANYFPFPMMKFQTDLSVERDIDFLFIGTYRQSKNFESSIDRILSSRKDVNIFCCSYGLPKEFLSIYEHKISIENRFLSDFEMKEYFSRARYVVLPYRQGSSSGIPLLAASCGAVPVMSDCVAFSEYRRMIDSKYWFESEYWLHHISDELCNFAKNYYKHWSEF